jgi:hypothetical protein
MLDVPEESRHLFIGWHSSAFRVVESRYPAAGMAAIHGHARRCATTCPHGVSIESIPSEGSPIPGFGHSPASCTPARAQSTTFDPRNRTDSAPTGGVGPPRVAPVPLTRTSAREAVAVPGAVTRPT